MTTTDTPSDSNSDAQQYDVAVIGGGPAGCSAAVFTARADLSTVCFEHDRSALLKSAHLENYLGFPAGIQPAQFLELAREHVREAGCTYHRDEVASIRRAPDRPTRSDDSDDAIGGGHRPFVVETDDRQVRADRVVVASWARTSFLDRLDVTREPEEPGPVMVVPTDGDGRTDCPRLYAAGRITSTNHQAIVNAGDGADVALTLIRDVRPGYYNDWVVPEGYYESYDREVPEGVEEIPIDERRRRARRATDRMAAFFASEQRT